jgi:hypothetical protein
MQGGLKVQARIVGASRGARWLGEGWQLFRPAPLAWLALSCAYLLGTNVLALVPAIGIMVALILVPPLTVGMMAAARAASAGAAPRLAMLAEGLRREPRAQLALGMVYLACSMLILAATNAADGAGGLRELMSGRDPSAEAELDALVFPLAVFVLLYLPVSMMFWFSPPLIAWHATGAPRALFFSFVACMLNWRAFLAYGASVVLMMVVVPGLLLLALRIVFAVDFRMAAVSLVFPFLVLMLPTLFASFYASYRDVFGVSDPVR